MFAVADRITDQTLITNGNLLVRIKPIAQKAIAPATKRMPKD
jgi:hypothetical protein